MMADVNKVVAKAVNELSSLNLRGLAPDKLLQKIINDYFCDVSYNVSDSSDDSDSDNDRTESANVVELAGPEPSTSAESALVAADVALSPLPTSYGVDTTEEDEGLFCFRKSLNESWAKLRTAVVRNSNSHCTVMTIQYSKGLG